MVDRIRTHKFYTEDDLYDFYSTAHDKGRDLDVFTIVFCGYFPYGRKLSKQEFISSLRSSSVNQYCSCSNYLEYKHAMRAYQNAVLPDKTVLTIFTDYSEEEFEHVKSGGFISPEKKDKVIGLMARIYNSNSIENIPVTMGDTITILAGGETPNVKYSDKQLVLNARDAFELRSTLPETVTLFHICKLHYELMKGVRDDAGKFRDHDVLVGSASHSFPNFQDVPKLMSGLSAIECDDPLLHAAKLHAEFINIHPFGDGNGRIGRLITHPYTNIPQEHRLEYYTALDAYGSFGSIYPLYQLLVSIS